MPSLFSCDAFCKRYQLLRFSFGKPAQGGRTDFLLVLGREGEDAIVVNFADPERELQRGLERSLAFVEFTCLTLKVLRFFASKFYRFRTESSVRLPKTYAIFDRGDLTFVSQEMLS